MSFCELTKGAAVVASKVTVVSQPSRRLYELIPPIDDEIDQRGPDNDPDRESDGAGRDAPEAGWRAITRGRSGVTVCRLHD